MVVGMAQWRDQGVPGEYSYLVRTIPSGLLAAAADCGEHQLNPHEGAAVWNNLMDREKKELENEVSQLRRTLDEMVFDQDKSEEERIKAREAWENKVRAWRLFDADSAVPPVIPSTIALELHGLNNDKELLPAFSGPPETYPEKVDYLIHGSVEMVEGVLYFTLGIFSFWEARNLVLLEEAYLPEDAGLFIEEARMTVIDILLGRDWAGLTVKTAESGARLYLNGIIQGQGSINFPFLVPGRYEIQARAPGYRVETLSIDLVHRQKETLELVMTPIDWTSLKINTTPEGADLYLGSRWLGLSPWEGELPPDHSILSIRKQDYQDISRYLPEKRKKTVEILLPVESFDVEHLMETQKKRFYNSLGTFVLTLPIPFILQGLSQYTAQAWYNENTLYGSNDETERLRRISLFMQGALFVNMVIDAVRYVKTTDLMFTR
jgi:hypothetical protein